MTCLMFYSAHITTNIIVRIKVPISMYRNFTKRKSIIRKNISCLLNFALAKINLHELIKNINKCLLY